jgi:hypothetical protein
MDYGGQHLHSSSRLTSFLEDIGIAAPDLPMKPDLPNPQLVSSSERSDRYIIVVQDRVV